MRDQRETVQDSFPYVCMDKYKSPHVYIIRVLFLSLVWWSKDTRNNFCVCRVLTNFRPARHCSLIHPGCNHIGWAPLPACLPLLPLHFLKRKFCLRPIERLNAFTSKSENQIIKFSFFEFPKTDMKRRKNFMVGNQLEKLQR